MASLSCTLMMLARTPIGVGPSDSQVSATFPACSVRPSTLVQSLRVYGSTSQIGRTCSATSTVIARDLSMATSLRMHYATLATTFPHYSYNSWSKNMVSTMLVAGRLHVMSDDLHLIASGPGGYGTSTGITFDRFVRACVVVKTLTEAFQK